jgi:hypothetical protein
MSRYEPRWVLDSQSTDQDVTVATPAFVPSCLGDYDDGSLGCEAMIGGLDAGITCDRLRYEAK